MSANVQSNCKVFIGSIPMGVTEQQLLDEAGTHGTVQSHYFCPDGPSGKGWAFVNFNNSTEAENAIQAINGKLIFKNTMNAVEARFANTKNRLPNQNTANNTHSGSRLPPGWAMYRNDEGKPYYHHEATNKTTWDCPVIEDKNMTANNNVMNSNNTNNNNNNNRSVFGPVGANLFIFHIPNEWTDQDLYTQFVQYGEILSARIQKDPSGRNKGFGFVSYHNGESAHRAISMMDGRQVCGKWLKVQHKKGEGQNGGNNANSSNTQNRHMNHNDASSGAPMIANPAMMGGNNPLNPAAQMPHNVGTQLRNMANPAAAAMLNSPYGQPFLNAHFSNHMNYYNPTAAGHPGHHHVAHPHQGHPSHHPHSNTNVHQGGAPNSQQFAAATHQFYNPQFVHPAQVLASQHQSQQQQQSASPQQSKQDNE
eukprot:GDKK01058586.1.p1 GENE.GDKK01058586.1~~GDKK01058586.1.p1  ORF type:complete len:422 (+),score=129.91 GDKK01058586.1:70-1335(+)